MLNLKNLKKFPGNKALGKEFMFYPVDSKNYSVADIPNLPADRVLVMGIYDQGKKVNPKTGKRLRALRIKLCLVSDLPDEDQKLKILSLRNKIKLELLNIGIQVVIKSSERTFSSLCKKFRVERLSKFKDSWTPSQQLKRWESELGHMTLDKIKPIDVAAAKKVLLHGRSPKTVNNYLWAISGCFDHGIKRLHWISYNPVKEVEREEVNNEIDRYMSDEERKRFFEGLESTKSPTLKAMCHFGINTGCRKGEALGLTWDDIDFDENTISFTKTKRARTCIGIDDKGEMIYERNTVTPTLKNGSKLKLISMKHMPELRTLLIEHKLKSNGEFVFPQDTQHSFNYLLKKCQIDNFRFHDLRHSCASYLVQSGVPLLEAAHHLGQKDYNSVLRYAHLAKDTTEKTGDIVANRIYGTK